MSSSSTVDDLAESSTTFVDQLAQGSLAMARSFARGAQLWCVAPDQVDHALHVAVEFVHPVIVGKRALPASAIADPDPIPRLRRLVKPGDMVLSIGPSHDPDLADVARRSPAWGVETFWIGWGPTPEADSSAFPLWLDNDDNATVVRAYHLLWELTHLCFERPDVMPSTDEDLQTSCKVCTDELTLAEVVAVEPDTALVRTASGMTTVDTTLIDPVVVNDLVLLHAGTALRLLSGAGQA